MDNELTALTTIFTEFYYWMTVVLMFLIHVGFCMYEVGASRYKHHQTYVDEEYYVNPVSHNYMVSFLVGGYIGHSQLDRVSHHL